MSGLPLVSWGGCVLSRAQLTGIVSACADASRRALPPNATTGLVSSSTSQTVPSKLLEESVQRASSKAKTGRLVERVQYRLSRMKRGVLTAARLQGESARRGGFRFKPAMVTLTYAPGHEWRAKHLSGFLDCARQYFRRAGKKFAYTWVAELQERGVLHYHVLVWMPRGFSMPKPDKRGWWPYGSTRIEWVRHAVGYLAKYASKGGIREGGATMPKGARINGHGGLDEEARREYRWWRAPKHTREELGQHADIRRTIGGRFCALTGLFSPARWRMARIDGRDFLLPVEGAIPC